MKTFLLTISQISFLLFGLGECQSDEIKALSVEFPGCIQDSIKNDFNMITVKNLESVIVQSESNYQGTIRQFYHIEYAKVPTGYLAPCFLPEEFKKNGLTVKISGTVYVPKNIDNMNLNAVPIELTSIQK